MLSVSYKLSALKPVLLCTLSLVFIIPSSAYAEGFHFTVYTGYRVGGNFTDIATDSTLELDESETYGFIISSDNDTTKQNEFIYSVQPTSLTANGPVSPVVLADIDVESYLYGSKRILNKESGTFVLGLVGATRFNPNSSSLNSETRFSLGLGGGIDHRIGKRLGSRLEGRGVATFLDSSGAMFCGGPSGGCVIYTESSVLWQFEVIAGITFRF